MQQTEQWKFNHLRGRNVFLKLRGWAELSSEIGTTWAELSVNHIHHMHPLTLNRYILVPSATNNLSIIGCLDLKWCFYPDFNFTAWTNTFILYYVSLLHFLPPTISHLVFHWQPNATLVNWKSNMTRSEVVQIYIWSSPNIDQKRIKAWIEWGKHIKHEKHLDAVVALWDSVVQNGEKIGISGALLPSKKTCYNNLKHCNLSSVS